MWHKSQRELRCVVCQQNSRLEALPVGESAADEALMGEPTPKETDAKKTVAEEPALEETIY